MFIRKSTVLWAFACGGDGGERLGVELGDVGVEAYAGLDDVDHDQADGQGQGGDDLEVEQRLGADPPDFLHVIHPGDAGDHRAENDGGDDHLDQLDEAVPQRFQFRAGSRGRSDRPAPPPRLPEVL